MIDFYAWEKEKKKDCVYIVNFIGVPIKVRRNHKRVIVFHDNRGQGSTLRSKDLNIRVNLLWYHLYVFRPLNTSCLI